MLRRFIVPVVIAASFAVSGVLNATPFSGKPPLIGGIDVLPYAIAFDAAGNRYAAGTAFLATADFDPGKGVQTRPAVGMGAKPFVSKFDATGKWLWTQTFGGTNTAGVDEIAAIAVSGSTVYAAGTFVSNDAGFGGLGTISAHTGNGIAGTGYVIALDAATGAPRTAFGGTGAQTFGVAASGSTYAASLVAIGSTLYVGGYFRGTAFGVGGSGTANSAGQYDGFVAAVDTTTGAAVTAFSGDGVQTLAGNGHERVRGLAEAGGVLYVGGAMSSTNFGVGATGAVSSGQVFDYDAIVVALQASDGAPVTAFGGDAIVTLGGSPIDEGYGIATANGVVYLTGLTSAANPTVDGVARVVTAPGGADTFVLAVNAATGALAPQFAGGLLYRGTTFDDLPPAGIVATATAVHLAGYLGQPVVPVVPAPADAYIAAFDPATGTLLPGFGDAGLVTVTGGETGSIHVTAQALALALGTPGIGFAGGISAEGFVGPRTQKASFPGTGGYIVLLDPVNGDPLNMGANQRPVVALPPIASPNPAVAGKPVTFKAVASDPDGEKLHLAWNFGDETFSASKSPKKTYPAMGMFVVTVTASDGSGGATKSPELHLTVVPANLPYFDVAKTTIALKFSAANADSIAVSGQFPLADGTVLLGKPVTIDVGGVARTFQLDAKGKSPKGIETVTVSAPKGGVAKFSAKLTKGSYAASFADEGMTNATVANAYAPTVVAFTFDGTSYSETVQLIYAAKAGKTGAAK